MWKRSCLPGTNVRSPSTSNSSPKSGTKLSTLASGDVRDDVAPDELVSYCLHAVAAAPSLPSKAAVHRLVTVILAGLQPPR